MTAPGTGMASDMAEQPAVAMQQLALDAAAVLDDSARAPGEGERLRRGGDG